MKKILVSAIALTMVALVSNAAMATVPDLIPVQGVLADDVGEPVDGLTDITFALYAAETGGSALWTDPFTDVDVVDGFFTVYLGSGTTLDLTAYLTNSEIWLGINVEGDGEMDRIQLATVPFAVQAQVCQAVGSLTESDINTSFAPTAHNHDAAYSAIGHNHDAAYAAISHNHDAAYAPISHAHAWSTITGMPAGFSDGVDNDTDTTYAAGAGLTLTGTTFSITTGGVTAAMLGTGSVDMDELAAPMGEGISSAAMVAGGNYIFPAVAFTPTASGTCLVSANAFTFAGNTAGFAYARTARRIVASATNAEDGDMGPEIDAHNHGGTGSTGTGWTATPVSSWAVTGGTQYQFGCYVGVDGGPAGAASFVGDTFYCRLTYFCF